MSRFTLDQRTRLSIELALGADDNNLPRLQQQEAEARRFGMSGAEIDAARRGQSFDAQISIAVALALASNDEQRRTQRARALNAGIDENVSREIEELAARLAGIPRTRTKSRT